MSETELEYGMPPFEDRAIEPMIPPADKARVASRVLGILAGLAIVIAVAVNVWLVPDARLALPGPAVAKPVVPGVPGMPEAVDFEKPSVEFLPGRILTYETITRQAIPGRGDGAGEAVYKTLNMNFEAQVAIVIYARAEQFNSSAEARARLAVLMGPYSANQRNIMLNGVTPAQVGEAPDGSAYTVGWVRGNTATIVKSSFAEWTPPDRVNLIKTQGDQITDAVDVFQRTGRDGVLK